jgi:hypothetical protein
MVINNKLKQVMICLIFLTLLFGFRCNKIEKEDDVLTLKREGYTGSTLKFDGIYYLETENFEGPLFQRYAIYRNGIIRHLGGSKTKEDPIFLSGKSKFDWGVFQIDGAVIKFERWYPSSGGPLKAYIRSGEILNDSTFLITESYRMQGGRKTEIKERNEIYHFKEFSPKPDSTNTFIK